MRKKTLNSDLLKIVHVSHPARTEGLVYIYIYIVALSTGAVENADCTSAEGYYPSQWGYQLAVDSDP